MNYVISILAVLEALYFLKPIRRSSGRVVSLIYFQLIYNLIIKFIVSYTVLPSMFNYVTDVVTLWILAEYFHQTGWKISRIPANMLVCAGLLGLISIVSYLLNLYSPLLYLWGDRNNFRFLLFAMMCVVYLGREDVRKIMDILFAFLLTNILVVTYQFFFLSYNVASMGDFISGLYSNGAERGGNGALGWLMCIVCTYEAVRYLNLQTNGKRLLLAMAGSIYMAALAEIKLFFVELVIICLLSVIFCRKTSRTVLFSGAALAAVAAGIQLLYILFPSFRGFFRLETILSYISGQTGYNGTGYRGGLNRLNAVPYVLEHYLHSWTGKLFGIGLGNADFSSYSFLTSDFYRNNSWNGYNFFSTSMVTVELGLTGLVLYLGWFFNLLGNAVSYKPQDPEERTIRSATVILVLITFVMILADHTMKLESAAYMAQCVLVFPYILRKSDRRPGVLRAAEEQ